MVRPGLLQRSLRARPRRVSLACGTPVFGIDGAADDLPPIVDRPETGRLFDGTEEDLARALAETLELDEDPATAATCNAHGESFSSLRSAERYVELFNDLR